MIILDELSSASENEEECLYRNKDIAKWIQSRRCIISKEITDLNPWIGCLKNIHHDEDKFVDSGIQCCLFKWPEVEKQIETDKIELQV